MELILFTTANGAEIIGEIVDNNSSRRTLTLSQPLVIRPIQKSATEYALDLFPHSLADPEGDHEFSEDAIVSRARVVPTPLVKAYQERTSKIVIAQALDLWEGKGK